MQWNSCFLSALSHKDLFVPQDFKIFVFVFLKSRSSILVNLFVVLEMLAPIRNSNGLLSNQNICLVYYFRYIYMSKTMIFINCAINPILYNVMSAKFRNAFYRLFNAKPKPIHQSKPKFRISNRPLIKLYKFFFPEQSGCKMLGLANSN